MPEMKLRQYVGKRKKSTNVKQDKDTKTRKDKLKTIVETKKFRNHNDAEDDSLIMIVKNKTLDDSIWKDSFDRFIDTRSPLRKNNIIKKNVRLSYNLDSSVNNSNESSDKINVDPNSNTKRNQNDSNSFLNKTPIFKRKSFLKRFDDIMNKNNRGNRNRLINHVKKSTISSTPLNNKMGRQCNKRRNLRSTKTQLNKNDSLFMHTISPIQKEDSPSLQYDELLLKTITSSEKKRIWKNDFRIDLSELNKRRSKAKRSILNVIGNEEDKNNEKSNKRNIQKQISNEENHIENLGEISVDNCDKLLRHCDFDKATKKVNNNLPNKSKPNSYKCTNKSVTNLNGVQISLISLNDTEENVEKSLRSLNESANATARKEVEFVLEKSLTKIGKTVWEFEDHCNNLSILEDLNSDQNNELISQSLQIIEHTYNSILENAEIPTADICEKFNSIEKSLDNLISNSQNSNSQLNSIQTTEENLSNPDKVVNSFDNFKISDDIAIDKNSNTESNKRNVNVFENNVFINKLKFLQNCLAINNEVRRRSLPVEKIKNVNGLARSNSTNTIRNANFIGESSNFLKGSENMEKNSTKDSVTQYNRSLPTPLTNNFLPLRKSLICSATFFNSNEIASTGSSYENSARDSTSACVNVNKSNEVPGDPGPTSDVIMSVADNISEDQQVEKFANEIELHLMPSKSITNLNSNHECNRPVIIQNIQIVPPQITSSTSANVSATENSYDTKYDERRIETRRHNSNKKRNISKFDNEMLNSLPDDKGVENISIDDKNISKLSASTSSINRSLKTKKKQSSVSNKKLLRSRSLNVEKIKKSCVKRTTSNIAELYSNKRKSQYNVQIQGENKKLVLDDTNHKKLFNSKNLDDRKLGTQNEGRKNSKFIGPAQNNEKSDVNEKRAPRQKFSLKNNAKMNQKSDLIQSKERSSIMDIVSEPEEESKNQSLGETSFNIVENVAQSGKIQIVVGDEKLQNSDESFCKPESKIRNKEKNTKTIETAPPNEAQHQNQKPTPNQEEESSIIDLTTECNAKITNSKNSLNNLNQNRKSFGKNVRMTRLRARSLKNHNMRRKSICRTPRISKVGNNSRKTFSLIENQKENNLQPLDKMNNPISANLHNLDKSLSNVKSQNKKKIKPSEVDKNEKRSNIHERRNSRQKKYSIGNTNQETGSQKNLNNESMNISDQNRKSLRKNIRTTRLKLRSLKVDNSKEESPSKPACDTSKFKTNKIKTKNYVEITKVQNVSDELIAEKLNENREKSMHYNETIVYVSPEVLQYRKVRHRSLKLRKCLANSKVRSLDKVKRYS
ncbi:putative uncharacterized protein DDB_G0282133 [Condylostylus longicornis]|uniref:putative uncharacterized protein DDB_G0282133 n=1 Tax=Condylostylus longicornis TaxID=2530218 RepID=UPI00244DEF33|nr:putative uncharacterized protein DDB_G0282133 [Condylostylus longicornis]